MLNFTENMGKADVLEELDALEVDYRLNDDPRLNDIECDYGWFAFDEEGLYDWYFDEDDYKEHEYARRETYLEDCRNEWRYGDPDAYVEEWLMSRA